MTFEIEFSKTNLGFLERGMTGRMRRAVSLGVQDSLVVIETGHKYLFLRGRSKSPAVPNEITWRTGALAKSYRVFFKAGQLLGYYGSTLHRAALLEFGGTITPRYKEWLHFFIEYGPNPGWVRVKKVEIKGRFLMDRTMKNEGLMMKIEDIIAKAFDKGATDGN